MAETRVTSSPDTMGTWRSKLDRALTIVGDVFAGTLRLRQKRTEYLPKWEGEESADYEKRIAQAVLYNAFGRTVEGLAGMLFRKELKLGDDVPELIRGKKAKEEASAESEGQAENIDNAGTHLSVFARDLAEAAIRDGMAGFIVDYPKTDWGEARPTLADIRARGLRPYWVPVYQTELRDIRTITVDGRAVVGRLRYTYCVSADDGEFGEVEVRRVKEWKLNLDDAGRPAGVSWREFELRGTGDTARWEGSGNGEIPGLTEIPWAAFRTKKDGSPPLLDLALENIDHYQVRSDRKNNLAIAGTPIPIFRGRTRTDGNIKVGPSSGIDVEASGGAEYLEPKGSALEHSRTELQDIEKRMAVLGLAMLAGETRQAETATSKRIDQAQSDSNLMSWATNLGDALEQGLRYTAIWNELAAGNAAQAMQASGGSVTVNRDFQEYLLDPQMAGMLLEAVAEGRLTLESFLTALKNGLGRLMEFIDPAAEAAKLGETAPPPPALPAPRPVAMA